MKQVAESLKQVNHLSNSPSYYLFFLISITCLIVVVFVLYSFMKIFNSQREIATINKESMEVVNKIGAYIVESEERIVKALGDFQDKNKQMFKLSETYFKLQLKNREKTTEKILDNTEEIKLKLRVLQEIHNKKKR